jgi:hypothetical protein
MVKIRLFVRHILSFLHRPEKISDFCETVRTHIHCQDVYAKFILELFDNQKYVFEGEGAYAPPGIAN